MATRCVEELHVLVDAETQQTGPYRAASSVQALGERWKRDARKLAATGQYTDWRQVDGSAERSAVQEDLVEALSVSDERAAVGRASDLPGGREAVDGLGLEL